MYKYVKEDLNKKEILIDIRDVKVDVGLPKKDRINSYLQQINNPQHFKCNDIEIIVKFTENGQTLEECIMGIVI